MSVMIIKILQSYPSTTWELLASDKYIRTGATPLSTGGSNSVSISKTNLPNVKLKVDSFSLTTTEHKHDIYAYWSYNNAGVHNREGAFAYGVNETVTKKIEPNACFYAGGQNTGTASPSTETLGSGTALSIQPAYITLKFWKRLS